ncbi:unnamed protein product, partial [Linum tenue]
DLRIGSANSLCLSQIEKQPQRVDFRCDIIHQSEIPMQQQEQQKQGRGQVPKVISSISRRVATFCQIEIW